jgi:recyclin-1
MSLVLDHLAVYDQISFARVSKRMREMVYDDTRWIRRLQLIGCWDEAAARANADELRRKKLESLNPMHNHGLTKTVNGVKQYETSSTDTLRKLDTFSIDPDLVQTNLPKSPGAVQNIVHADYDGFDFTTLSPINQEFASFDQQVDIAGALQILSNTRSIRGAARQSYGRIHLALNPYYKDALRCRHPSNAKIFRVYRDPIQQAQMLSQLIRFAKCDLCQGAQSRMEKIKSTALAFEDAVAREFEQGQKLGDVDGRMKKYAHVLATLNGGQRALDIFIASNPVILDRAALGDPMDCFSPSNPDHIFLEEAHMFWGHLSDAYNAQISIIDRVFPASMNVVVPFLHVLGKEVISKYLGTLFGNLCGRSPESYVRAVSGTYEQCLLLVKSMQPTQNSGDEFYDALDQMVTEVYAPHVENFFVEELAYFKRRTEIEVSSWERQLSQQEASLESMYMSNVNRQADKRDFLTSFRKVVMMPVNVLPNFPITSRFSSKSVPAKHVTNVDSSNTLDGLQSQHSSTPESSDVSVVSAPVRSQTPTPLPQPPATELAAKAAIMKSKLEGIRTLFSLEVALNLVHMAKGSLERTAVFARARGSVGELARGQCETIFIILVRTLGDRHVRAGFDRAVEQLAKYNPRAASDQTQPGVAPLVIFLELVNVGDLIQQMLDVFYEQELVATKLTDRNDFLNPTVKEKKRFEQMLDERVAAGLNKGIDVLMAEVEFICATTQKVEDFNPGASGMVTHEVADINPSDTAVWIVEVMSAHTKMLVGSTDKNMLDVFNQEVGLRLFTTLCKHLKRQRISVAGSIKLIRYGPPKPLLSFDTILTVLQSDMNHYFTFIQSLKNRDLQLYFRALRELAQIYLIDPADAKELAAIIADNDRFLGIFRAEEVYEFAERRADWYQVKSRVEKAMYGIGCCVM